VKLVSQHSDFFSQHTNFFPWSESWDPVGNRHLDSFPHNLLNGLIWHVKGVSGAGNIKSVVDLVYCGCNNCIEITLETFVVSRKTIGARGFNNLIG
jgi:hypothetical protein